MVEFVPVRIFHMEIYVIQERVFRRPQFHFLQREHDAGVVGAWHGLPRHCLPVVFYSHFQRTVRL